MGPPETPGLPDDAVVDQEYVYEFVEGREGRRGLLGEETDRDSPNYELFEINRRRELARLPSPDSPPFFARVDLDEEYVEPGTPAKPRHADLLALLDWGFYVGYRSLEARDGRLVVNWQASLARLYYESSHQDTLGVRRRRDFDFEGLRITGVDDTDFRMLAAGVAALSGTEDQPSDRLLEALDKARGTEMADIVKTIRAEQYEIMREPLLPALIVQGGPGTGKSVVGIHRVSWLLYNHRDVLKDQDVVVVGPNTTFVSYVRKLLPELGDVDVPHLSVDELSPLPITRQETPAVAELKGSDRMPSLLAQALENHRTSALQGKLPSGRGPLAEHLSPQEIAEIADRVRRDTGRSYEAQRSIFASALKETAASRIRASGDASTTEELLNIVEDMLARAKESQKEHGRRAQILEREQGDQPALKNDGQFQRELAWARQQSKSLSEDMNRLKEPRERLISRLRGITDEVDRVLETDLTALAKSYWPTADAKKLYGRLLSSEEDLRAAAQSALDDDEIALLVRPRGRKASWSAEDALLIEELEAMIHGVPPEQQFKHVLLDEAQNLSPLQRRAVGRRSRTGSMTVLGDINQSTGPWANDTWPDILADLGIRTEPAARRLDHGYRVPAGVMRLAARLIRPEDSSEPAPRSWRNGPDPSLVRIDDPERRLAAAVDAARRRSDDEEMVALIVPSGQFHSARDRLAASGEDWSDAEAHGLGTGLNLLRADASHGLEFDAVVLLDPGALAEENRWGKKSLYVAMTRTTKHLDIFHGTGPLPWD